MGNIWRVLKRDVMRLVKTPPALVVALALLVLPSAYTWYNVAGFWDPYNNTGELRVDVVNEDAGAESELTGQLNVGSMIVDELHENTQLNWQFNDRKTAMDALESGESYAVFVIPDTFTENLLTLTTGNFTQPDIQYYVNEKTGPVAPKITDTGASTLDETINSAFVSTVSNVATEAVDQAIDESQAKLAASRSDVAAKLDEVSAGIAEVRDALSGIASATEGAQAKAAAAQASLAEAQKGIDAASDALASVSSLTGQLQTGLADFSAIAAPALNQALHSASQASSSANAAVGDILGSANEANSSIDAALAQAQGVITSNEALIESLQGMEGSVPEENKEAFEAAIDELEKQNDNAQTIVNGLESLSGQVSSMSTAAGQAADAFDAAAQQATNGALAYSDALFGTTMPALTSSLGQLSATAIQLSGAIAQQKTLVSQTSTVLDQLASTLVTAKSALSQTDDILGSLERELADVRTDVTALGQSSALTELVGENGLDAAKVAEFMGSPTKIVTEQLYELNAYGSAMAPLFMNLTFWIGAFMLLVIMKQEVDAEGVRNLTLSQRYLGRFALLAGMAVLQAIVCCAGVLFLGVQAANVPALFLAAIVASLAYLSIIYALSVTLQHIGKGVCIVLVFAQIPGATGLYPIEMTSPFFQALYPLFPFTYGIGAMREAICGFYGSQYALDLGVLLLFFFLFVALGLLVRPRMANVNRMVASQVRESGIFNGEDVEVPVRPYRFSQLFRALADKDEYRAEIERRYERFEKWHPRLIRGSIVAGVAVPVLATLVFALTPTEKVTLLTIWLAWIVVVCVFLVVVESMKANFERQLQIGSMSEAGLIELGAHRDNSMSRTADAPGEGDAEGGRHA